ncbi:nucleotidyl transferase AbiEii/AbiGii toxin family protein, partial [Ectothiorhodospira sp. A-7Y]|nr:nucleotidyl transferase AbiEii/AbiGii toxin family protein [Ectothiorhodospira lacustris]MCG5520760.1 nucleotidyl transferase AbiEii/AbiGii toxin family protein [Ectothiorhodospira lacustris]
MANSMRRSIASSPRPTHQLLAPGLSDLHEPYAREFVGMTTIPISVDELEATRVRLIADIRGRLCDNTAQFLLSLHDGEPDFEAIGLPQAQTLPAIRWKLFN